MYNLIQTRVLTICQSKSADKLEGKIVYYFASFYTSLLWLQNASSESTCMRDGTETEESDDEKDGRSYGSLMIERLTGTQDGRIDHMLQVKFRCIFS